MICASIMAALRGGLLLASKDGTANAIFVTCEQWENMKVYPALDKFKKKSQ